METIDANLTDPLTIAAEIRGVSTIEATIITDFSSSRERFVRMHPQAAIFTVKTDVVVTGIIADAMNDLESTETFHTVGAL